MNYKEEEFENGNLKRYCLECGDGFYAYNRNRFYCEVKYGKRDYCKTEAKKKAQRYKRGVDVRKINLLQRSPVRNYILNPTEGMKKIEEILQGKKVLIINVAKLIQHGFTEAMVSSMCNLPYRLGTINFVGPYVLVRVSNSEVAILTP
jgi:hypothetical protein